MKTGDNVNLLPYILLMTLALILGILAVFSRRRDRKDGDEA